MVKRIIIEQPGGPEELKLVEADVGDPGPGEIRIAHRAVGLNFIDCYHRSGLYPLEMPHGIGMEAAGVVEAVGDGVTHLKEGDRAAYAAMPPGAYADARVMPAAQVCPLPDDISFEDAASVMLQGLTVNYLFHRTTPIAKGDTVLLHAAAGGVGLIACQWARAMGVRLIGTAGSAEKCKLAEEHGADVCINYREEDFVARVKELTDGEGVPVVMDSVGKDTFDGSFDCLAPLGFMILFGSASGPVPPFDLQRLAKSGSLKITRPTLFAHIAKHETCQQMAEELFARLSDGSVKTNIGQTYPLSEATEAHRSLEARETTGSTIFTI